MQEIAEDRYRTGVAIWFYFPQGKLFDSHRRFHQARLFATPNALEFVSDDGSVRLTYPLSTISSATRIVSVIVLHLSDGSKFQFDFRSGGRPIGVEALRGVEKAESLLDWLGAKGIGTRPGSSRLPVYVVLTACIVILLSLALYLLVMYGR